MVVWTLNGVSLVTKMKFLLVSIYNYFSHCPKHHLKINKFVKLLKCKNKFWKYQDLVDFNFITIEIYLEWVQNIFCDDDSR
jgi:hypothetical protein